MGSSSESSLLGVREEKPQCLCFQALLPELCPLSLSVWLGEDLDWACPALGDFEGAHAPHSPSQDLRGPQPMWQKW